MSMEREPQLPLLSDNRESSDSKGKEVIPKTRLFEYTADNERELAKKIFDIPIMYPAVGDAYKMLQNDQQLQPRNVVVDRPSPSAQFNKELNQWQQRVNPICMAYLLHTIGSNSFGEIVSRMAVQKRGEVLGAILGGNVEKIYSLLLPLSGKDILAEAEGRTDESNAKENERALSLTMALFGENHETIASVVMSPEMCEQAKIFIREHFAQAARKISARS